MEKNVLYYVLNVPRCCAGEERMLNFLWMLLAFAVLTGIAMVFYTHGRYSSVEGLLLAMGTVILVLLAAGAAQAFSIGFIVLLVLGGYGLLSFLLGKKQPLLSRRNFRRRDFFSPGYVLILAGFLYAVIAFAGNFLRHWDEFHQWGLAVRYMLETGKLPIYNDFLGGPHNPAGTGLFHLFFQLFSGLNIGNMHASSFLLVWGGMMLPTFRLTWKDWKRALLYAVIVYFSYFVLYYYPYTNLYTDMPLGAWAGGLCAWWCLRKDRRHALLLPGIVLFLLPLIKWQVGALFSFACLFFMAIILLIQENRPWKEHFTRASLKRHAKAGHITAFVLFFLISLLGMYIWTLLIRLVAENPYTAGAITPIQPVAEPDRIPRTILACLRSFAISKLSREATIPMSISLFLALVSLVGWFLHKNMREEKFRRLYRWALTWVMIGFGVYFLCIVYSYVTTFPYDESVRAASMFRYYSIYAAFTLPIFLMPYVRPREEILPAETQEDVKKGKWIKRTALAMLVFLLCNLNGNFIYCASHLNNDQILDYNHIERIAEASPEILDIVQGEKVYMIRQGDTNKPLSIALYYFQYQVNQRGSTPWQFNEKGCQMGNQQYSSPTIYDLPAYLLQGGYGYVWIYSTDAYLNENLPKAAVCDSIVDGGLYRVIPEGDGVRLTLVGQF